MSDVEPRFVLEAAHFFAERVDDPARPCEGVTMPDGGVRCFVDVLTRPEDFLPSTDHIIPRCQPMGACAGHAGVDQTRCVDHDDESNLHVAHVGCQYRQAGAWGALRARELAVGIFAPGAASKGGKASALVGSQSKAGKIGGKKVVALGVGVHAPDYDKSKGGKATVALGVGIHAPGVASKAGKRVVALARGIHAPGMRGKGAHVLWHVNRGQTSPTCEHCAAVA